MKNLKILPIFSITVMLALCSFSATGTSGIKEIKSAQSDTSTRRTYYGSGRLKSITYYSEGKKNGVEKEYYENGELQKETPYEDGVKSGIEKEYWDDGEEKAETPYYDGTPGVRTVIKSYKHR
jgi:antitoxin component YwqK of YwqJK toxin-antitoxin module